MKDDNPKLKLLKLRRLADLDEALSGVSRTEADGDMEIDRFVDRDQRYILSTCLFCEEGIHTFGDKYIAGVNWILTHGKFIFDTWTLRLYVNRSIEYLDRTVMDKLLACEFIETMFVVRDDGLKLKLINHHLLALRFLPFTEVSTHEVVITIDIDQPPTRYLLHLVSLSSN